MLKLKMCLIFMAGVLCYSAFALEEDPFVPMLPQEPPKKQTTEIAKSSSVAGPPPEAVTLPAMVLSGVLWGTDKPMVIIDDKVYGVGSIIVSSGAKIHKIEKNVVTVIYKMQKFTLTPVAK